MLRKVLLVGLLLSIALLGMPRDSAQARSGAGVIYVTSQRLFYQTYTVVDPLPFKGHFQQLIPGAGPGGVSATQFGPGEAGYLGGRWWVDMNGNGVMDATDHYFLCPLLPPGSPTP